MRTEPTTVLCIQLHVHASAAHRP